MFGLQNKSGKKSEKTLREIYELWKPIKRELVKPSSFAFYVIQFEKHLLPYWGDDTDFTEEKAQAYAFEKLNEGLSLKTTKDHLMTLKMVLHFAEKKGWTKPLNRWDIHYPRQKYIVRKIDVLSKQNHKKLLDHVTAHFTFENLGYLITLNSGMRIGEICALRWEDIDMENRVIHVNKTMNRIYYMEDGKRYTKMEIGEPKTINSVRDIPISTPLLKVLRPLKKVITDDDFFVLSNSKKPIEPHFYRILFHRLLDELGIPRIRFHGLRHTFATRCIESKCDYKTVSEILGHANIGVTLDLYVHPNLEQKQHCVDQMHKALKF